MSPYELWKGRKLNLSYLKVWGCITYYRVPKNKRIKLEPRALKSVFVGYAENSKPYRLHDLDCNMIVESRDAKFFENKFLNNSRVGNDPQSEPSSSNNADPSHGTKRKEIDTPFESRRNQRQRKEKSLSFDFIPSQAIVFLVESNWDSLLNKTPILFSIENDPKTFSEIMKSRDSPF